MKSVENQLKVNWNQLKVSWNQLKVNRFQLKSLLKFTILKIVEGGSQKFWLIQYIYIYIYPNCLKGGALTLISSQHYIYMYILNIYNQQCDKHMVCLKMGDAPKNHGQPSPAGCTMTFLGFPMAAAKGFSVNSGRCPLSSDFPSDKPSSFHKSYGVPPNHPFIDGFSIINHRAIGVTPLETL